MVTSVQGLFLWHTRRDPSSPKTGNQRIAQFHFTTAFKVDRTPFAV